MIHSQDTTKPAGAYRVLHTADWHLGKMLGEHSRQEEHQRFLDFLLRTIREQQVDLLLIAGDVFDSANPPQSALAQYYDFLSALFHQGGCAVVIVAGNHDSPAHLEAPRQVLKALGFHVIGALPHAREEALIPLPNAGSPRLVVAAVPFLRDRDLRTGQSGQSAAEIQRALVAGIRRCYDEVAAAAGSWTSKNIALLALGHLTIAGSQSSDSEREIHVGGLGAVGVDCFCSAFAYVALGHLHRPQAAKGNENVRYAGSPIPLSFGEAADRKAVRLLDFIAGSLAAQTALEIPPARHLARISVSRQSLDLELGKFSAPAGELLTWVEVIVEDPVAGENLYDRAREIARAKGFEVIQVSGKRVGGLAGLADDHTNLENDIPDLLAEPAKVFAHRLDTEPGLTDAERERLKTVFQELLELHTEQERQGRADSGVQGSGIKA